MRWLFSFVIKAPISPGEIEKLNSIEAIPFDGYGLDVEFIFKDIPPPTKKKRRNKKQKWSKKRSTVLKRDNYICRYCGIKGGNELTVDHVIPVSRGGHNTNKNLVACCSECNQAKADKSAKEFLELNPSLKFARMTNNSLNGPSLNVPWMENPFSDLYGDFNFWSIYFGD